MIKKHKYLKVIAVFLLLLFLTQILNMNNNTVHAEINEIYSKGSATGNINLNKAVEDATLIEVIARFIYAIAGFLEKTVGKIIGSFTGTDMFPWADRIIFNVIPFLDINFINPSAGSMFESQPPSPGGNGVMTAFGKIIGNMYYTIFILSLSFLGVIVGVMAIKLAISSIASEKAKYKAAIQNWLLALILVFTSHYLISFIFFVNEKMVEVASILYKDRVENMNLTLDASNFSNEEYENMVKSFTRSLQGTIDTLKTQYDDGNYFKLNISNAHEMVEVTEVSLYIKDSNGNLIVDNNGIYKTGESNNEIKIGIGYDDNNNAFKKIIFKNNVNNKKDIAIKEIFNKYVSLINNNDSYLELPVAEDKYVLRDALFLTGEKLNLECNPKYKVCKSSEELRKRYNNIYGYASDKNKKKANVLYSMYTENISNEKVEKKKKDMILSISDYFKKNVYTYKRDKNGKIDSYTANEFSPIPAILYSIFVIQSLMYFIAYMKRFFYIIILALFAPLVIIYDFFTKSVST